MSQYDKQYREIGKTIAVLRTKRGLSQETFADMVGVTKSYISKIEAPNSTKPFSLDVLFRIAEVLELDIRILFSELPKSKDK